MIIEVINNIKCYISEAIDVNKTRKSRECDICHNWYFLDKSIKFQPNVYNGCHDLLMMSMNLNDIAILNIKSADYCCRISGISKNKAINLMQNTNLTEKKWNIIKHKDSFSYKKRGEEILTFGDIEIEKTNFTATKTLFFKRCRY